MTNVTETGTVALCVILMCAALAAQDAQAPKAAVSPLCEACLEVCTLPLSHEDAVLDESTDSYMPAPEREIATAAAIALAAKLKDIYRDHKAGHFGRAYEVHAANVETLASKHPQESHASSAEVRSLKRVRTGLYADTIVGLRGFAATSDSQEFLAAYRSRAALLNGVLDSLPATQQMRAASRLAVCEVLAAYPR